MVRAARLLHPETSSSVKARSKNEFDLGFYTIFEPYRRSLKFSTDRAFLKNILQNILV